MYLHIFNVLRRDDARVAATLASVGGSVGGCPSRHFCGRVVVHVTREPLSSRSYFSVQKTEYPWLLYTFAA